VTSPPPTDGVAGETVNATSPYVFSTGVLTPKLTVRRTDPGVIVVGGASTIGGAGGATDVVDDSFAAIVVAVGAVGAVVAVGAMPRVGSAKPGFFPVFDFFPLPETMDDKGSPTNVVVVVAKLPPTSVDSTDVEGELFLLASNTTGVDNAKIEAAPIASACAPENFSRNQIKAPLRRLFSSISTSKSSFMSSMFFIPVV
jgi:hypothetical protein